MRSRTQIRPIGEDNATDHAIAQQRRANDELEFIDSEDIGVKRTSRGIRLFIKKPSFGGGTGSFKWQKPYKELDPTKAVAKDTFVAISPDNPLVTDGILDLISGNLTKASPGIWQAAQDIPAKVTNPEGLPAGDYYNVPQLPLPGATGTPTGSPLKGDYDSPIVFWIPWAGYPFCWG